MDSSFDFRARPADSGEDALPLPAGTLVYESLTTRFVSFERLLETLSDHGHSGYVKLVAPNANGIVLLRQGRLVESLYRAPEQLLRGEAAIRAVEGAVIRGDGVLDIVSLAPDVVDGLHGVASGRPTYPELFASWVNAEGLVAFLREREFSGSMIVSSTEQSGVVMFEGGRVTGAFTSSNGELADHEGAVLALCGGPQTRIELRELEQAVKPARSEGVLADAVTALIEAP